MSSLTNPYVLSIIEINKEIDFLSSKLFNLRKEKDENIKNPIETVCIKQIEDDIFCTELSIENLENKLIKTSKFIKK